MNTLASKLQRLKLRKNRIRSVVSGSAERPRLSVFISNRHLSAQIIDDSTHRTLTAVTTVGRKDQTGSMSQKAEKLGKEVALKAKTAKITQVVFDRNGRQYHGRIKSLAESARKEGLEF